MSIYIDKHELAEKKDVINPNLAYSSIKTADNVKIPGSTNDFTFTASNVNNFWYCKIPLNLSLSKGDAITISAFATLSGPQATDGLYKATIYSSNLSAGFDDTKDTVFLKSGIRSSKTIFANKDSNTNNQPVLFIYSGVAGKTGGNTIHVQEVKVERGTVATPYVPAVEDLVLKSDYDALSARLTTLESKMGGVKPSYRLYYAISKEVA